MSRVLLVTASPPLPFGTAAARWYYVLLRGLVARGHRVTAFASCATAEDAAQARETFPQPEYDLRCFRYRLYRDPVARWQSYRRPSSYLLSPALRRDLAAEMTRGYDVLHLEHNWTGWVAERAPRAILAINFLAGVDLVTVRGGRLDRLRRDALVRAERRLLRRFGTMITVTAELAEQIAAVAPRAAVHTVPLAFDVTLYPFEPDPPPNPVPIVGLIGSFGWEPTYQAGVRLVDRLWPAIKRRVPDARLQLVGRRAAAAFRSRMGDRDVRVFDNVPEITSYFRSTDVLVYAPPVGSGMKVKVMEAFALGTPVVVCPPGVEGIPAADGVHAGIAERDDDLVERIVALLGNPARRRGQRIAARGLIEAHCDPTRVLDLLEGVYATCA